MTHNKAKQKAVAAIQTIVEAAKELAEAEAVYYERKRKPQGKETVCTVGSKHE